MPTYEDALAWLGEGVGQDTDDQDLLYVAEGKEFYGSESAATAQKAISIIAKLRNSKRLHDWVTLQSGGESRTSNMAAGNDRMGNFLRRLESEKVMIKVSTAAKQHSIPKELLCSRSKWFKSALEGKRFREGQMNEIVLDEDQPEVFEAFLYWVYQNRILFEDNADQDQNNRGQYLQQAVKIWMFGDKYILPNLQNAAMHRVCQLLDDDCYTCEIGSIVLAICYTMAKDDSPIRMLIADHIVM